MQKACFTQAQHLPCRLVGYTASNDVMQDVREINALFGVVPDAARSRRSGRRPRKAASG